MRCPTLSELPPPPPGKACTEHGRSAGWPWTEESPQLPDTMPSGEPWPRVSIVTPSYNQEQFIEETIRSVLLQGYPHLEYIIIDGGSTDDSADVIRKYERWLAYWVSEKDRGQTHAINKGWEQITGEITSWLNSDDLYRPNAIRQMVEAFRRHPEAVVVIGACAITDAELNVINCKRPKYLVPDDLLQAGGVPGQPSVFFKTQLMEKIGGLDENLHFVLDWEYWLRVGMHYPRERMVLLNVILSDARFWEGNKSSIGVARTPGYQEQKNAAERRAVLDKIYADPNLPAPLKKLRTVAYSCTYWQQAHYEFQAGQLQAARHSVVQAWLLAPAVGGFIRTLRFLAQTCVSSAMGLLERIQRRLGARRGK